MTETSRATDVFELLAILPKNGAPDIHVMGDLDWSVTSLNVAIERAKCMGIVIDARKDRVRIAPKCWGRAQMLAESHWERTYN